MKNKIKSYLVFTSEIYRVIAFVLVPVALILMQIWLPFVDLFLRTLFTALIYSFAEVMLDYWVFGSIAVKGGTQLEYIKTSKRGVDIIRTALVVDMVRQLISTVLLFIATIAVHACMGGTFETEIEQIVLNLLLVVFTYFVIVSELTIARHLDGLQVNLIISCFTSLILLLVMFFARFNGYIALAVMIVLSVVSSILGVKMILKRVKESYYDKTA